MANIDSPIFDYLRDVPEGPTKVAIEHLFDLLNQTRDRTGGDNDLVASVDAISSTNFYAGGLNEEQRSDFSLFTPEVLEFMERGEQSPVGVNSTTTPTTSFTGTSEQNDHSDVMVSCYSDDQAGTLYFDFSVNGSDWRTFPSSGFQVSAGAHEFHTAVKGPRYFRARWTSSSAPTTLQLFTYYGSFRQPSAPLNQPLALDADAILVRPSFPWLDVSRGLVSGMQSIKKFGRNAAVGTSFVPIAMGGVYQTPQGSAATALRIKSGGDANDTAAGSGARSVTLEGLDENFELATEALATAGASASSATSTTFTRLFRAYVTPDTGSGTYASSSAGSHADDIVVENSGGGTDWATIDATDFPKSQSEIGAYSVPSGYTAYVKLREVTIDSGKTCDLIFFWRANADESAAPYSPMRAQSVLTGVAGGDILTFGESAVPFGPYVGPCDLGFMGKVSTGTASISVEFEIVLVNE